MTKARKKAGTDLGLNEEEKAQLRQFVKETIHRRLEGKPLFQLETDSTNLNQLRGAFVSLHKEGRLRGCIGHIRGDRPLKDTIKDMAVAAAFDDPRFPPLSQEEFDKLDIEISVLTPLQEIDKLDRIEVGKHGIYITKGYRAGLLLPQVATEYGWDRNTFLQQTCVKAGLPLNAWKDKDTRIFIFSADIF